MKILVEFRVYLFDVLDQTAPVIVAKFEGGGMWENLFGSESVFVDAMDIFIYQILMPV